VMITGIMVLRDSYLVREVYRTLFNSTASG